MTAAIYTILSTLIHNDMMTEKDKMLLGMARKMDWEQAAEMELERQAETSEGMYAIHSAIMRNYHREEWKAGMI